MTVVPPLVAARRSWSFQTRLQAKRLQFTVARMRGVLPVVTYATWRTASTSVHHAIRASGRGACVKAHALHAANIRWKAELPFFLASPPARHVGDWAVSHFIVTAGRRADWVVLVRDPLAIAMSLAAYGIRRSAARGDRSADLDRHVMQAPVGCLDWWLEHDMRPALGWSALDVPFDRDRGWVESECAHGRVLVLRADVPDERKGTALSRFLGTPVTVVPNNDSRSSGRGGLLSELAGRLSGHPGVVSASSAQRSSRHFWHEEQLQELRARWLAPV